MRMPRIREDENVHGTYYHLMNRVPGTAEDRPLGEVDRHREPPTFHVDQWWRVGEQVGVVLEIVHSQRRRHDHQLQWGVAEPAWRG